ncbi:MAG: hypothetical protein LQ337_008493 [Flavoplaca oasis]|nr:MAG: hypothetical protein LQ337_008493 [Flavoplaca oasis]
MPPLAKRRRLLDTEDPDAELQQRRLRNNKKLKSRFESIFEKYSKDFSGIGDVIDFEKDEIVVDNGHLRDMKDEKDPGNGSSSQPGNKDPPSAIPSNTLPIEQVIPDSQDYESDENDPLGILEDAIATSIQRVRKSVESSLSRHQNGYINPGSSNVHSFPTRLDNRRVEPAWRVPLLPADVNIEQGLPSPSPSIVDDSSRSASPEGVSIWALPERKRRTSTSGNLVTHPTSATLSGSLSKPSLPVRPWTQEERHLLRQLKASGKSWAEIAKQLPNRTLGAIQVYWYSLQKKSIESPTQLDNASSDDPALQSPDQTSNDHNVFTNESRPSSQVKDLCASELATTRAPGLAASPDAELRSHLASSLLSEVDLFELSKHAPGEKILCSGKVVPDSQDSPEPQQSLEANPNPQTQATSPLPDMENGIEFLLQSEVPLARIASSPPPPGSSSHASPNANDLHPNFDTFNHRLQNIRARFGSLHPDPEVSSSSSALAEDHRMQDNDLHQSNESHIGTLLEHPSNRIAESKEHPVNTTESSSSTANESDASSFQSDESIERLTTPITMQTLSELLDTRASVAAKPELAQSPLVKPGYEHETDGGTCLSRSIPSPVGSDPQSISSAETGDPVTDISKPIPEAASTSQKFVHIEISPLSNERAEKQVISEHIPEECSEGMVIVQGVQDASHVTPLGTPPGALLPAQEESLRKIKPFSLILPIGGSPTMHQHLQWKSPYLQSLDQKYRFGQGNTQSDAVSPRIGVPQPIGSDPVVRSTTSAPVLSTEDSEFSGNDIFAPHGSDTDIDPEQVITQNQTSPVEEDEDDLQFPYQPTITPKFQGKGRQSSSGSKQRLAFPPKLGNDDTSDDELSTPLKTTRDRIEMTPVQAS